MDEKSALVLELPKILEQLAVHSSFSAGAALIRQLRPTGDLREALDWQQETTEARTLLQSKSDLTLGGARDVRGPVEQAEHGIILDPPILLDIRGTLRRAGTLKRTLGRLRSQFPALGGIAEGLEECAGLQNEISAALDDNGNIYDSASPKLAIIRRDLRVASDKLQSRLNSLVNNPNYAKYLQEQLVTQRNGRYVVPLRSEFKGKIPGIVHDQSSSGATIFIEPLVTVELNNSVRELQLAEEDEIRRILRELSGLVAHEGEFIVRTVDGLAHLDLIFAKARYAEALNASASKLLGFREGATGANGAHPGSMIHLEAARHPLLDSRTVVPIDLSLDENTYALVITGPNTGGKTVALKTIGLLTLMAQCGLHIPADDGAVMSVFEGVYADIGDEQSIEQSLSTFSSHMTNTIKILREADRKSLVLLDELGAGTDPAEGAALARAILIHLLNRSVTTLVTTHHPELKVFSQQHDGVRNASVEFDLETLRPTYRLVVGIPGRSNALAIASRLGLPAEIIEQARGMVATEDLIADNLLDELAKTREETRHARDTAITQQKKAEALARELRERLDDAEKERQDVLTSARRVAERELDELRREIRKIRASLQTAGQPLDAIKRLEEAAFNVRPSIESPGNEKEVPDVGEKAPGFRLGQTVWVQTLKSEGQITEMSATDVEVAIGRLRVRAKLDEIERRNGPEKPEKVREPRMEYSASPGLELDLRGARVEDALQQVDNYLDAAYMAGLPFVRIIHGKGTGALRKAIRDVLHAHPLVSKYQRGEEKEGGDGVTVVNLVPMT